MRYEYFVSYVSMMGLSNCVIHRDRRIKTMEDIDGIGMFIAKNKDYPTGVIVLNYRLIRLGFKKRRVEDEAKNPQKTPL